jgi:hypothetical protein
MGNSSSSPSSSSSDSPPENQFAEQVANKRKRERQEEKFIGHVFDSDQRWVCYMSNKVLVYDLAKAIMGDNAILRGACVIADEKQNLYNLTNCFNLDVVTSQPFKGHGKISKRDKIELNGYKPQEFYESMRSYKANHLPLKNKINVYLFGDVQSDDPDNPSIHWICLIINLQNNTFFWYDPALQIDSRRDRYTFLPQKFEQIKSNFIDTTYSDSTIIPAVCAQQNCSGLQNEMAVDVFCQSWVFVFVGAYLQGINVLDAYFSLDFRKHQMLIVKTFLKCAISNMQGYEGVLMDPVYRRFFLSARTLCNDSECTLVDVPAITGNKSPCILFVLDYITSLSEDGEHSDKKTKR